MEKNIWIIGAGRIGSKIAEKLSKIYKNIVILDRDTIEKSNIETGYLFRIEDLEEPKALIIKNKLNLKEAIVDDLSSENINMFKDVKLIIDGTDNFETRFLLNDFAVKNSIPYIFASVIEDKGMVFPVIHGNACLRCIFNEPKNFQSCETLGVKLDVVDSVTDKQLEIALKILKKEVVLPELYCFTNKIEKIVKVNKKLNCKCCVENKFDFLNSKPKTEVIKFCGSGNFMIKANFDFNLLKVALKNIKDYGSAFKYKDVVIYRDKMMLKADSKVKAKNLYLRLIEVING